MQSKALLGLIVILSFYALYDFLSTKKYEWISVESKIGLGFLTNILTLSGLINILLLYEIQLHFTVYIAILLCLCVTIQYLTIHFGGFRYKIPYSDTTELSVMLKNVLWYQGYKNVEQIVEYRENKFSFPGEKKTIEIEFREGFFSKSDFHILKFKKWTNRESREAITESLDSKLERYEPDAPSTLSKVFAFVIILISIVGLIGYYNYEALRPNELSIYDSSSAPEVLILADHDILITEPSLITSFEEQFKNSNAIYDRHISPKSMNDSVIKVTYGDPYRTLYIGPKFSYLYVDFEAMKENSSWDHLMVSMYGLYGKQEGVYYFLFANDTFYDELTRIIQNN
ncbi:MAG: hypothetical protein SCL54_12810 [Bacillota bacterium]|nr:hypothetical protein [Bacillota bacterium]